MQNLTAAEAAERRTNARRQHKALVTWEKGGRKGDRPETPDLDALNAQYVAGGARKTRTKGGPRKPRVCPIDGEIRDAFTDGRIAYPMSVTEIAKVVDRKASSSYHGVQRLLAAGELVETKVGRAATYWLTAAGKPGERPPAPERETATKTRRTYQGVTASKTVHTCHRRKVDGELRLVPVCVTANGKIPAVTKTDGETTCKNCTKLAAAEAA